MTNEQKYAEVLKELGALLADKNATISSQRWQIQRLEERAAKAEKALQEAEAEIATLNANPAEIEEGAVNVEYFV